MATESARPAGRKVSWVVAVLSFVGAQLVALPFLAFLALASSGELFAPPAAYVTALFLLAGSIAILRLRPGLFVENLCLSGLLSGMAVLLFAIDSGHNFFNDDSRLTLILAAISAASLIAALLIDTTWIQRVLGFMAALLIMGVWLDKTGYGHFGMSRLASYPQPLIAVLLALAWAGWHGERPFRRPSGTADRRSTVVEAVDAVAAGVGVAVLLALAWADLAAARYLSLSDGAAAGSADAAWSGTWALSRLDPGRLIQILLTLGAFAWLTVRRRLLAAGRSHELRLLGLSFALLLVFAPFTDGAGVIAVIAAAALIAGHRHMLALAGLTLLVKLSGFYYALQWTLADKAALLAVCGALLGAALWLNHRLAQRSQAVAAARPDTSPAAAPRWVAPALLGALAVALGAVHWDVREKERIIAEGQKIFIPLAPRDPRSLMQGDYMALNFALPWEILDELRDTDRASAFATLPGHAVVVARMDARGIATVVRPARPGEAPAGGEILLPLKWMRDSWTLVTDAFYFPEGQGVPFAEARFGEFRVLPDGRALLVGLADERLQAIRAAPVNRKPPDADDPQPFPSTRRR